MSGAFVVVGQSNYLQNSTLNFLTMSLGGLLGLFAVATLVAVTASGAIGYPPPPLLLVSFGCCSLTRPLLLPLMQSVGPEDIGRLSAHGLLPRLPLAQLPRSLFPPTPTSLRL